MLESICLFVVVTKVLFLGDRLTNGAVRVVLVAKGIHESDKDHLYNFESADSHGEDCTHKGDRWHSPCPVLLVVPGHPGALANDVNRTHGESKPGHRAVDELPLGVGHMLGHGWQRADAKDEVKCGSKRAKHERSLAIDSHSRKRVFGVNKESTVIAGSKHEARHEDVDSKEPERDQTNLLSHSEEVAKPGWFIAKRVAMDGVRHACKHPWDLRDCKAGERGPGNGLVHAEERKAIPRIAFSNGMAEEHLA